MDRRIAVLRSIVGGCFGRVLWKAERDGMGWRVGVEFAPVRPIEAEVAGATLDTPSSFVDQGVVVPAEHDQVVEACGTALGPGDEMVDVTPSRRPVASGEDAVQVTGDDGNPEGGRDQSLGLSHVERLAVGTEHDHGQVGVTGDPRDLVGGEEGPKLRLGDAGLPFEQGLGGDVNYETGPRAPDSTISMRRSARRAALVRVSSATGDPGRVGPQVSPRIRCRPSR